MEFNDVSYFLRTLFLRKKFFEFVFKNTLSSKISKSSSIIQGLELNEIKINGFKGQVKNFDLELDNGKVLNGLTTFNQNV